MANIIGRARKLDKKTQSNLAAPIILLTHLHPIQIVVKTFNQNIDITSKELLSAEKHYSTNSSIQDKPSDHIQTKPVSIQQTKNMINTNFNVDDDRQYTR